MFLPKFQQKEITKRTIEAAFLTGVTFRQYSEQLDIAGINGVSHSSYQRIVNSLWLNIDARWTNPYGYNSEQGTVSFLDAITGKLLYVTHFNRHRGKERWYFNYQGSAKGMEGHGVTETMKKIKEDGFLKFFT